MSQQPAAPQSPRPDVVVHGPRLDLVPVGPEHHGPLRALHLTPAVRAWWRVPDERWPGNPEPYEHFYAVVLGTDLDEHRAGTVIGFIQWKEETEPDYRHASIDLFLDPTVHGRGLGTELLQVLCAHLVDDHGLHRITIDPEADNAPAVATYRKVGFKDVGILRQYTRNEAGQWRDGLLLDMLADDLVRVHGEKAAAHSLIGSLDGAEPPGGARPGAVADLLARRRAEDAPPT